jgi:hypothetical protein
MPKHNVTFLPSDRRISVDEEENLLQVAMDAGFISMPRIGSMALKGFLLTSV